MASLLDTYTSSLPTNFASADANADEAQDSANVNTARLTDAYQNRALPALRDRYAARGSFFSGHADLAAQQLNQDYQNQTGDIQRNLQRTLAGLAQRRVLATYGGDPTAIADSGAF